MRTIPPLPILDELREWQCSRIGRLLHASEQRLLDRHLPQLFGYHLLQITLTDCSYNLTRSPISHRIFMTKENAHPTKNSVLAQWDELPFAEGSVDVVVLSHVLEYIEAPDLLLREVSRLLIPEGTLLIFGFNPYSLCGLRRLLPQRILARNPIWNGRFLPANKIQQWLSAYGLEESQRDYYFYRPPIENPHWLHRLNFLEKAGARLFNHCGGAYLFQAKKHVAALQPIVPQWGVAPPLRATGKNVIQPTPRLTA